MPWLDLNDNDPGQVDMAVRSAIHLCWDMLPAGKQRLDEVERVVRQRVDRGFAIYERMPPCSAT